MSTNVCIALIFVGLGINFIHLFVVNCTNCIISVQSSSCTERVFMYEFCMPRVSEMLVVLECTSRTRMCSLKELAMSQHGDYCPCFAWFTGF